MSGKCTSATDSWIFGTLLVYMFTERFYDFTDKFERENIFLALERKRVVNGFASLVKKCLEKDPQHRIIIDKIFEEDFFLEFIEFSAKSLKMLPGKFTQRVREVEEEKKKVKIG